MGVIRILTEKVASQIAAGEVVERPASVVRELLDNSIDAGSDRIMVRIESGGKRLIRVSDNGAGMERDDLLLCLERHATSKITTAEDLLTVSTLGFRGEALPSIGSVSRLTITTRPANQLIGHRLSLEGGKFKSIEETGSPAGTIVEVKNLFYNIPARKKFLKTTKTEADHVIQTVSRMALPFAEVHFRLDENGRTIINLPTSSDMRNRLSSILGATVAGAMEEAFEQTAETSIRAYLGPPEMGRSRGDKILIYVNRRHIRDRSLTRAVMEGYGQRLMKGRYPQAVVIIEMPPTLVDLNVHPTKQEVRFREQQLLYQRMVAAVKTALGRRYHVPWQRDGALAQGPTGTGYFQQERIPLAERGYAGEAVAPQWELRETPTREEEAWTGAGERVREGLQILGQLKDTYILCQTRDGLLMIDQHAAHERVVYETLRRSLKESKMECQSFLIPYKVELPLKEGRVLEGGIEALRELGLEIEHFGGSTFLLRSVPSILLEAQWENLLNDLVTMLVEEKDLKQEKALDRFLTISACHGAIRAGQRLSRSEMVLLIRQLEAMDLPTNCPHGRPVAKEIRYRDIEKMFKRVV